MLEAQKLKKLKEKRKTIISRLKELNHLPHDLQLMTDSQRAIYDQLEQFDFSFWEKVKLENGWGLPAKSPEERAIAEKKKYIREYFRQKSVLPKFGEPLNEEQQKILDAIDAGDFSYHEEYVKNVRYKKSEKELDNLLDANNSELSSNDKLFLKNKRERIRVELRALGLLPKFGEPLNEEQQEIMDKINNNDFSPYYDLPEEKRTANVVANSLPKMVLHRLRLVQILPPFGEELNEEQQAIVDDVNQNWQGKNKNFFITKYLHLTTPEGRIYYRMYKAHKKDGYNFKLQPSDIDIPEYCPILNIKLSTDPKDKDLPNYYSPDRIDSGKGYVTGNVRIISQKANKMKTKATQEDILKFAYNGLLLIQQMENNVKS
jgi:hypothetical protein